MGLDIELQDERGERLQSTGDAQNLLIRLLPDDADAYPMLASIDPYGDTVFNRIQMGRFLREWEAVSANARSADERILVGIVQSMAVHCRDEVHLYLKFIGD